MAKLFGRAIINQTVTVYNGGTTYKSNPAMGTGEPQEFIHGLPFTPVNVLVVPTELPGGSVWDYSVTLIDNTRIRVVATAGVEYLVFAWTSVNNNGPIRLMAPGGGSWDVVSDENGVINTVPTNSGGTQEVLLDGNDGSRWRLTVDDVGILTTAKVSATITSARLARYAPYNVPAPGAQWEGSLILVEEAGFDTELRLCRKTAAGGYEWVTATFASATDLRPPLSSSGYEVVCTPEGVLQTEVVAYKLRSPNGTVWDVKVTSDGVLSTSVAMWGTGPVSINIRGTNGSLWVLSVLDNGTLLTASA